MKWQARSIIPVFSLRAVSPQASNARAATIVIRSNIVTRLSPSYPVGSMVTYRTSPQL